MPWIFYQKTADAILNDTQRVQFTVSLDKNDTSSVNELVYYLAK